MARSKVDPQASGGDAEQTAVPGRFIKIVYFDEQSASDYLDMSAGGKAQATSQDVRKRATDMQAQVDTKVAAKLSWLPFMGASAEIGASASGSQAGESLLSKTLSNTILTDYLHQVNDDIRVQRLHGLQVTAPPESMAFMKMYTPYMIIAKNAVEGIDLARLDEALVAAKGYYELLGEAADGLKCVLRFNIRAFRNNYGLTDLRRMNLVFHGVRVGQTKEADLALSADMSGGTAPAPLTPLDLLDDVKSDDPSDLLDVFDVMLAGVEHDR